MVNYILSKSPNGLFLIFERSVQFDFTIRQNKIFKNFFEGVTILTTAINLALLADYYIISHDLSSLHTVLKLILFIFLDIVVKDITSIW